IGGQVARLCCAPALTVGLMLLVAAPAAATPDLFVIRSPAEVPASTDFSIQVRVVNTTMEPIGHCRIDNYNVHSESACIVLGYRFWRTPKRETLASVDTVALLREGQRLGPGESIERKVTLQSPRGGPRGSDEAVLNLYLIQGP